jgi:hypothetical protein
LREPWWCIVIEHLGLWEGAFTAERAARRLGISREHVQRELLPAYDKRAPDRLVRRPGKPSAIEALGPPTQWFPADAAGFLAVLGGLKALADAPRGAWPLTGDFESVPLLCRSGLDNEALIALNRAMTARRAVDIEYRAKKGLRSYRFSPHALIDTGPRPHFRGFAADPLTGEGRFLDLVPSRVLEHGGPTDAYVAADEDRDWHERVDLTFALRGGLSADLREAVAHEHDLDAQGRLTIYGVRRALERYVVRHFTERRLEGDDRPIFEVKV